jgi:hypothetical protein
VKEKRAIVITSISSPNEALRTFARGASERGIRFVVVGDEASPATFRLDGCEFFDIARQTGTGFRTAAVGRRRHYARKNVGYLIAMGGGAEVVVESDDDNLPEAAFWEGRPRRVDAAIVTQMGWINVYQYFTDARIWPRGLPLDSIQDAAPERSLLCSGEVDAPIQQGLADGNPDVDAVYRLALPLPVKFRQDTSIALARECWCPFNSQNTTWWREAFPLLYLPSWCSFRMTDIWRSFVAQRIAWENGWVVLFHGATVRQERNEHHLMRDFEDEVPGYLYNRRIANCLEALALRAGGENSNDNLRICYEALVREKCVDARELGLLDAWLEDVSAALSTKGNPVVRACLNDNA